MIDRIRNEPALLSGFVLAVLTLLAAFGLDLTAEQTGSISAVVAAGLAVLVRSQVTPTHKLEETGAGEFRLFAVIAFGVVAGMAMFLILRQLL